MHRPMSRFAARCRKVMIPVAAIAGVATAAWLAFLIATLSQFAINDGNYYFVFPSFAVAEGPGGHLVTTETVVACAVCR